MKKAAHFCAAEKALRYFYNVIAILSFYVR